MTPDRQDVAREGPGEGGGGAPVGLPSLLFFSSLFTTTYSLGLSRPLQLRPHLKINNK
jgi:hypothetical protein